MPITRRQFVEGAGSLGAGALALSIPAVAAAKRPTKSTPTERAVPIEMQRNGTFDGIMDIYFKNEPIDLAQAKRLGARAVLYRTSMGLKDVPAERDAYRRAKDKALSLGLLWGAYHVPGNQDFDQQLTNLFKIEDGTDQQTLLVLDWETNSEGLPTAVQMGELVMKFKAARGYFPMIYGGRHLADQCGKKRNDILAQCPLWFIYILSQKHPTLQLPMATWSDYTFWQYATEHRAGNDPYPPSVLFGADWSRYKGTAEQLAQAWPFRVM